MTTPHACPACLRRSWLLAALGPYIERAANGPVGRRAPQLLRLGDEELADAVAPGDGRRLLAAVAAHREAWFAERLAEADCWAVCRHDGACPGGLRDLGDAPCALIGRGEPSVIRGLEPQAAVTIVGSRRADSYGREVARNLGNDLAAAGVAVISGLAFGIDACAHRGALDAGGTTIAVLGCGPDTSYPAAHRGLWRRIAETGAVISELPPGSVPWRWSFPARSRVMAALAGMTVVVEAAARSGSLVTADLAAELGRDVGAVPGPVISRAGAGPNALLADGACVVRDGRDVLDALTASPAPAGRCPDRRPSPPADHGTDPAPAKDGPARPSRVQLGIGAILTPAHREREEELRRSGWPVDRMSPRQVLLAHEAQAGRHAHELRGEPPPSVDRADHLAESVIAGSGVAEAERLEQMRRQIRSVTYDGTVQIEQFDLHPFERWTEDRIVLDKLLPYVRMLEAKIERTHNIAEAAEPDEDWRPATLDDEVRDTSRGVGPSCPNCGARHGASAGCALGVVVSVIRDRAEIDPAKISPDTVAQIDVHRFWEALQPAVADVERQLGEITG